MDRPRFRRVVIPAATEPADLSEPAAPADRPLPIELGGRRRYLRRQRQRRQWLRAPTSGETRVGR